MFVSATVMVRSFPMMAGLVAGCWCGLDRKLDQRLDGISKALEAIHNQESNH